jgi:hypothetical protein
MKFTAIHALALIFCWSTSASAQDEKFNWAAKPVLCGDTVDVAENISQSGYDIIATSNIILNDKSTKIGTTVFLMKDGELIIIENIAGKSCMISVTKDFSMTTREKGRGL